MSELTNQAGFLELRGWRQLGGVILSRSTVRDLIDSMVVAVGFWLAYVIRFDGVIPEPQLRQMISYLPITVLIYLIARNLVGVQRQVWHFFGPPDAARTALSVFCAANFLFLSNAAYAAFANSNRIPIGVTAIHPLIIIVGWCGTRFLRRSLYSRKRSGDQELTATQPPKRFLLVGAGQVGVSLVQDLRLKPGSFQIVGFLDDNPALKGRMIEGVPVLGKTDSIPSIVAKHRVDQVTLCMPSAPAAVQHRIAESCRKMGVQVTTVPTLSEILLGKVEISRLRPVRMEDLLCRSSVDYSLENRELAEVYSGRRILVTGAGGSIGSELVRQLKELGPSQLILLDKDENSLYEIGLEIRESLDRVTEVVADIRDLSTLIRVFEQWRPEVVFHAAAYKHVPLMEHHPSEAVLNNVMGTRNVVEVSNYLGVSNFVLISTDKAVNPTSMMGATKRIAELIVQNRAADSFGTRFCCVRFGNVLGSRASVVQIFQKQIREGKAITITHPQMRRYFMTIPEAVRLVIQAGTLGQRGEVFVLDMGTPVRITDLARNLVQLLGLRPEKDVPIRFTGLRPGEKLDEELLLSTENGVRSTKCPRIFVAESTPIDSERLQVTLDELEKAARISDVQAIKSLISNLGIGYHYPLANRWATISSSSQETLGLRTE
ncbi:MAG TPA: nucleoside-diphosphate sugar epimerase/dehydratase [Acidobacteriota bacterium]|nr:nucleoside-diphosphate sugar epimerase/dehydratase [Acidobacteriota bacterium]